MLTAGSLPVLQLLTPAWRRPSSIVLQKSSPTFLSLHDRNTGQQHILRAMQVPRIS